MEISDSVQVTQHYTTRAVQGGYSRPSNILSVSETDVTGLIEKLEEHGVVVERANSSRVLKIGSMRIKLGLNESRDAEGGVEELVLVSDSGLHINIKGYSHCKGDGKIGCGVDHTEGVQAELVYAGENVREGIRLIGESKRVVEEFYKKFTSPEFPGPLDERNARKCIEKILGERRHKV